MGREGHQEVVGGETVDARKAAIWSLLAALGQLALVVVVDASPRAVALAVAYPLILPAIAVLHVRHRAVRESGAILATIAGTAAVVVGILASVEPVAGPAALFVLGMWWWTIGKTWVETRLFARPLGLLTAALGALAIAGAIVSPLMAGAPAAPAAHAILAAWLALLATALLGTTRDVPSA